MERATAIRILAATHARILGLDALGLSEVEIAAEIDLDVVSVGPLLAVARAKLDALEALAEPDLGETAETRGS
jgi:DNA-directed RNA polymerase specialized sigma24 family protein